MKLQNYLWITVFLIIFSSSFVQASYLTTTTNPWTGKPDYVMKYNGSDWGSATLPDNLLYTDGTGTGGYVVTYVDSNHTTKSIIYEDAQGISIGGETFGDGIDHEALITTSSNQVTGIRSVGDVNNYFQQELWNKNCGDASSVDFVLLGSNGNDTFNYFNIGKLSDCYNDSEWTIGNANDVYMFDTDYNVAVGSLNPNGELNAWFGDPLIENRRLHLNNTMFSTGNNTLFADFDEQITGVNVEPGNEDYNIAFTANTRWRVASGNITSSSYNSTLNVTNMIVDSVPRTLSSGGTVNINGTIATMKSVVNTTLIQVAGNISVDNIAWEYKQAPYMGPNGQNYEEIGLAWHINGSYRHVLYMPPNLNGEKLCLATGDYGDNVCWDNLGNMNVVGTLYANNLELADSAVDFDSVTAHNITAYENLYAGSTNLTTTQISEGNNLYYTPARVVTAVGNWSDDKINYATKNYTNSLGNWSNDSIKYNTTTQLNNIYVYKSGDNITGKLYVGSTANGSDFPNAQMIVSKGDSGHTYSENIGLVGESSAEVGKPSIGIGGVARTNGLFPGYGIAGRARSNDADSGGAIGVEGLSEDNHTAGSNIAFYASAYGGLLNYSFYGNKGKMYNYESITSAGVIYSNTNEQVCTAANGLCSASLPTSGSFQIINITTSLNSSGNTYVTNLNSSGEIYVGTSQVCTTTNGACAGSTYTNGSGLLLNGGQFNISDSYMQKYNETTYINGKFGTLTDNKWCIGDGGKVVCEQNAPSTLTLAQIATNIGNWSADKSSYATDAKVNSLVNLTLAQVNTNMGNWSADKTSYNTTAQNALLYLSTSNGTAIYGNLTLHSNQINSMPNLSLANINTNMGNASKLVGNCGVNTVIQNMTATGPQCVADQTGASSSVNGTDISINRLYVNSESYIYNGSIMHQQSMYCDFVTAQSVTMCYPNYFGVAITSGTSAVIANGERPNATIGVVSLLSTTAANTGYTYLNGATTFLLNGSEQFKTHFYVLADTTGNNSVTRLGFLDTASAADQVDGAYLEQTSNVTGVYIVAKQAKNSVRNTSAMTTLVANSWYYGKITVSPDTSSINYLVFNNTGTVVMNETLTGQTTIPNTPGRQTGSGIQAYRLTAGTARAIVQVDYIHTEIETPWRLLI